MNKELIKKYKEEFDWWLDGEVLLVSDKTENPKKWLEIEPAWENPNSIYIIKDEYVELRKALAEGKTIQEQIGSPYNGFEWIDMLDKKFHKHISCYRIKSLEQKHKFKVGDWVRDIDDGYVGVVKSLVSTPISYHLEGNYPASHMIESSLELWKPQQGEWCWFWNDSIFESDPQLRQFKYMNNKKAYVTFNGYSWKYCKPFFGIPPNEY